MNKFNVFKFHFKKIVFSPYFYTLCSFALISSILLIVCSNVLSQNKNNMKKQAIQNAIQCYNNQTNIDVRQTINSPHVSNNEYVFFNDSNCKTLTIKNKNNNLVITSNVDEYIVNLFKQQFIKAKAQNFLNAKNYHYDDIIVHNKHITKGLDVMQMVLGIIFTVVSFILIMYLITIVFRQIAFEKVNKIWDMTSNKLDPIFLFATKIFSTIFLIGFPIFIAVALNTILIKIGIIKGLNFIKLPHLDSVFLIFFIIEFLLTFTIYALISGYIALYVKTVEQIQSMVGWAVMLSVTHYILALFTVQFNINWLKQFVFINPFSTLFSLFDSFNNIPNHLSLIIIPLVLQIILIIGLFFLIKNKFKKN